MSQTHDLLNHECSKYFCDISSHKLNCFLTCINTSRALKMQSIECGLFAPQCLLSVCLPFLAKVHPEPATKEFPPVFGFKTTKVGSMPNKWLPASPIRRCHFRQCRSHIIMLLTVILLICSFIEKREVLILHGNISTRRGRC